MFEITSLTHAYDVHVHSTVGSIVYIVWELLMYDYSMFCRRGYTHTVYQCF